LTAEASATLAEGRYRLLEVIGSGGMASVYRAFDTRLQVPRAIKVLLPALANRERLRARFEAEARTMALLEHRNIVRVYDVGSEGNRVYIVMELVEGGSLVDRLEEGGPLPPRQALDVCLDVLAGLSVAHSRKVVHRDIKPHNVLLTSDGEVRVTDFGIARLAQSNDNLTKTGAVMGTWGFMAPEQRADSKGVDERADLYAVAATLYSCVTNQTPMDLFAAELDSSMLADVPGPLAEVIRQATRYDREERFANVGAMANALRAIRPRLPEVPDDAPALFCQPSWSSEAAGPAAALPLADSPSAKTGTTDTPAPPPTVDGGEPVTPTMIPDPPRIGGKISSVDNFTFDALGGAADIAELEARAEEATGAFRRQPPRPVRGSVIPGEAPPSSADAPRAEAEAEPAARPARRRLWLLPLLLLPLALGGGWFLLRQLRTDPTPAVVQPADGGDGAVIPTAPPLDPALTAADATPEEPLPDEPIEAEPAAPAEVEVEPAAPPVVEVEPGAPAVAAVRPPSTTQRAAPPASPQPPQSPTSNQGSATTEPPEPEPATTTGGAEAEPSPPAEPPAVGPPQLLHSALTSASLSGATDITARVTSGAYKLTLYYRPAASGAAYRAKVMVLRGTGYAASLSLDASFAAGLEYHIKAVAEEPGLSNLSSGSGFHPHRVPLR